MKRIFEICVYGVIGPIDVEAENFEAACERLADEMQERFEGWIKDGDTTKCIDDLRSDFISNIENLTTCTYCGSPLEHGDGCPELDDDESWAREAEFHSDDCEWVLTRAHRID